MDAPIESITINSLDKKLDSKTGFSSKRKKVYRRIMTEAFLSEGMTEQNLVRFCNAFVATGIDPLVRLLNSEKGKDWKGIIQSLMKQSYFVNVVRMRLRFFMQLLSESIHDEFKDSQAILIYSIKNIIFMECDSKKKFRGDNISLFREFVLNTWKAGRTIDEVSSIKIVEQLRSYVLRCQQEDKKGVIKGHPEFPLFWAWLAKVSKQNQQTKDEKEINKPIVIVKPGVEIPIEEPKEPTSVKAVTPIEFPVVSLQKVVDLFEQRIVERDTEIKELKKQICDLKELIQKEKQVVDCTKIQMTADLEKKKRECDRNIKEHENRINSLKETLKLKEQLIGEQNKQLKEREKLLKDNDTRFENYYKQRMAALSNKLKIDFSDLRDAINDVSDDKREFLEVPLEAIAKSLENEGVKI